MQKLAVINQKGGVGKTTVSLCLADALARNGSRVLLVDLDPQATATKVLLGDQPGANGEGTIAHVMLERAGARLSRIIQPTSWGYDFAPSEIGLAVRETGRGTGDEHILREALGDVEDSYDIVLVDCPPSLGLLTTNALTAADGVVIVTEPSYVALKGLDDLLDSFEKVQRRLNPRLDVTGVIVNMVDKTSDSQRHVGELEQAFATIAPGAVWEPALPRRVVLKEAMSSGKSLFELGSTKGADELAAIFTTLAEQAVRHTYVS